MYKVTLKKPDGRPLYLYGLKPISQNIVPTNPFHTQGPATPHMRWHPLREEWVIYAGHRQNRTFLPPKDYSPLSESISKEFPTEMPLGDYDVAVFENLFPSLNLSTHESPHLSVPTQGARGVCEVVVFTKDPKTSLGELPLSRIKLIIDVWADRTKALAENPEIKYVMPFENRGIEMGVTLHHPHGQIYAYSFLPPVQKTIFHSMKKHFEQHGETLIERIVHDEIREDKRIIYQNETGLAFIPTFARYPYETWVTTKRRVAFLHELTDQEKLELAQTLKTLLLKFDKLWQRPFPYLMTLYQAPIEKSDQGYAHFFFQITPPYRTRDRLKYLAGTELGSGVFVNDSFPEEKAKELQEVSVEVNLHD